MSDAPDFETALKRLEEIVKKLENGELSLDSALELFEEGIKLSRFCHTTLEQAEHACAAAPEGAEVPGSASQGRS